MKKRASPQKSSSTQTEDSIKTVGECKALAKGIADWIAKQHSSPVLTYYEHISYAFDKAIKFASIALEPYWFNSESSKDFFVAYGHLHENLKRARELRGPVPTIDEFIKGSKYDSFLRTWPPTPGTTFGLVINTHSALEAAEQLVTRIEGAILSAQERAMGRGQGDQFDSLSIDDPRVGSWLSGVFTDEIRRLLGLDDTKQILRGHPDKWEYRDRWTLQELQRDAGALRSKLFAERKYFQANKMKNPENFEKTLSNLMTELISIPKFMERYSEAKNTKFINSCCRAIRRAKIKLPSLACPYRNGQSMRYRAKDLHKNWPEYQKVCPQLPELKPR